MKRALRRRAGTSAARTALGCPRSRLWDLGRRHSLSTPGADELPCPILSLACCGEAGRPPQRRRQDFHQIRVPYEPLFILLFLAFTAPFASAQEWLNCRYASGWQQNGAAREYTAANLFEYKDGAAEGYLSFGLARMTGITCKLGENTIDIDISEMKDADSAWGIFVANADPNKPVAGIGMGGQIEHQSATFARGSRYVEIVEVAVNPDADDSATMAAFAVGIERQLDGRDVPPATIQWFPDENLVSVRLVPESVLGLRELSRGYVAHYRQGQAFVIEEASPESAAAVLEGLRAKFNRAENAQIGDAAFQAKVKYLDGICFFRKGRIVAGYANLPDSADAASLAARLALRIP